jgi:hypothetical protein
MSFYTVEQVTALQMEQNFTLSSELKRSYVDTVRNNILTEVCNT